MTSQCPRCSAPHVGDNPICQTCGFDFRFAAAPVTPPQQQYPPQPTYYGQPTQLPAPVSQVQPGAYQASGPVGSSYGQPQGYQPAGPAPAYGQAPGPGAAPSVCLRCYAPLYPGYTQCGNCGFENRSAYAAPAPAAAKRSNLPIALALAGVALLAVAGVVVIVAPKSKSAASPIVSASPSSIALVSPTPGTTVTPAATETGVASAAPTVEPSPVAAWSKFTSPDGKWSVLFPGTMTPVKQTQAMNTAGVNGSMTMWVVADGPDAYAVAFFDLPAGTVGTNGSMFLDLTASGLASSLGGTLISTTDSTVGKYAAKDISIEKLGQSISLRVWFVGDRFYMMMVAGNDGDTVYPQHFMASFVLK